MVVTGYRTRERIGWREGLVFFKRPVLFAIHYLAAVNIIMVQGELDSIFFVSFFFMNEWKIIFAWLVVFVTESTDKKNIKMSQCCFFKLGCRNLNNVCVIYMFLQSQYAFSNRLGNIDFSFSFILWIWRSDIIKPNREKFFLFAQTFWHFVMGFAEII